MSLLLSLMMIINRSSYNVEKDIVILLRKRAGVKTPRGPPVIARLILNLLWNLKPSSKETLSFESK